MKARPPGKSLPDEMLEGFDDPVALENLDEPIPRQRAKPKPPSSVRKGQNQPPSGPIIPDSTNLAQASDIMHPPSSPSHPA